LSDRADFLWESRRCYLPSIHRSPGRPIVVSKTAFRYNAHIISFSDPFSLPGCLYAVLHGWVIGCIAGRRISLHDFLLTPPLVTPVKDLSSLGDQITITRTGFFDGVSGRVGDKEPSQDSPPAPSQCAWTRCENVLSTHAILIRFLCSALVSLSEQFTSADQQVGLRRGGQLRSLHPFRPGFRAIASSERPPS